MSRHDTSSSLMVFVHSHNHVHSHSHCRKMQKVHIGPRNSCDLLFAFCRLSFCQFASMLGYSSVGILEASPDELPE